MRRCVWSRNLVNEEALAHWGLSRPPPKKTQISYFMKICPTGAKSFLVDGRTDRRDEVNSLFFFFRNFANTPTNRNLRFAQCLYISLLEPKMELDYFRMFSNELLAYALHWTSREYCLQKWAEHIQIKHIRMQNPVKGRDRKRTKFWLATGWREEHGDLTQREADSRSVTSKILNVLYNKTVTALTRAPLPPLGPVLGDMKPAHIPITCSLTTRLIPLY